ncbi:inner membrane protein YiaA [Thalassotalea eurytherma]|nr:inner membrane protein YiaA [Thalassotalea eurytherma]
MMNNKPTKAFTLTCIAMLIAGTTAFVIGLSNATMELNEKGYYFAILIFGLFSFVSLQKNVRDKLEGLKISKAYSIMCWVSSGTAIALLAIGLINAELLLSEKGFYAMAYLLSGFAAITVQKNVRDSQSA